MADADEDIWGDDFDDFDLILATQVLEAEEQQRAQKSALVTASKIGDRGSGGTMSPTQAAQAFAYRRQNLQLTQESEPFQLSESMMSQDPQSCIKHLHSVYTSEKNKNQKLANDLLAAQGESCNLRRQVETLKHSQQEEIINRMKRERDEKQKAEDEKRNLEKEVKSLKTELRLAHDEVSNARSKAAMYSASSGRLSVGGAKAVGPNSTIIRTPSPLGATAGQSNSARFRSDPNLSSVQTKTPSRSQVQAVTSPPPEEKKPKVQVQSKSIQANEDVRGVEISDSQVFGKDSIDISHLESVASTKISETRQLIFFKLKSIIEKEFININPVLEQIVAAAPKEIMRRFVRFTASKTHFADVINSMFQWGIEYQRKKEAEANGEYVEVKYPTLPSIKNPPILDTSLFVVNLEQHFVYGSAWDALCMVKTLLKKLLNGLEGDRRFRLYEIGNLRTLWSFLAWTKAMWKFILFEEELEGVVDLHGGKDVWAKELKDWTGLILKIDWRDFYVPELESVVRRFSLSILENIVTLGYFEQMQRRYEILYCILKDTLTKDIHRNEKTIKCCLSIVTWSIADRAIFNYLCLGSNDGECLAYLLGEFGLKCFRETKDQHLAVNLVFYYFNVLETLLLDKPYYYFASKIARPNANFSCPRNLEDAEEEKKEVQNKNVNQVADTFDEMDVDVMMSSQFVCPDKFLEEGVREQILSRSRNVELDSCWILPHHWEVTGLDPSEVKPCQCRKSLLGSAFIMIHSIMGFWKQSFIEGEMKIEKLEALDEQELQKLEDMFKGSEISCTTDSEERERYSQLSDKIKSLRQFVLKSVDSTGKESEEDSNCCLELTWDELLVQRKDLVGTLPDEPAWLKEKQRPENIFDCLMRHGMVLMHFLDNENQNMAAAIGSEAFFCFTSLASDFRFYVNNMRITEVERALISEFTTLDDESEESFEENAPAEEDSDTDDDFNEDSIADVDLMPEFDMSFITDVPDNFVKSKFTEEKFEKAFKCFELEREAELFD
ncbi:unnamed protein product [Orchesella dallaii]|uniref:ATR-interacting protein mus304 n=1 Tax=Orchesella dallaii TaxID=48710 RepID=A0ABP1RTL9_9HEXA